jgi:hypothetical protein
MATKIKTMDDYKSKVTKAKIEYQDSKMNYNWNYNFKEEEHEGFMYFMITNHNRATKILFDKESNVLIEKTMYTLDIKMMMELQKDL